MQDLQKKCEYVREKIKGRISHPFLSQNIEAPIIDDDKLLLLVSFLDEKGMSLDEIEHYAVPTMLLQIALDTHEKVTNDMTGETNQKHRQLTVLAGIYYSGLYYKILAEQDDIEVIRLLAEGIEIINDQKIIVYEQEVTGIENLMESVKRIESSLYQKLINHIHAPGWNDLIANYMFIKRLILEKELFAQTKGSVVFDALKKLVFPKHEHSLRELSHEQKNYLILICDKYINFSKEQLIKAKRNLSILNEAVDEKIEDILHQHQLGAKSLVEEG
ncbi:heptaprenyl diphosphate synthase component 1 [Robertmurraya sp. Marseille-Q9965]